MKEQRTAVEQRLANLIAVGFHDAAEALAELEGAIEAAAPMPIWRRKLEQLAQQHEARKIALERSWADCTVNDRIDAAFRELGESQITAIQNVGWTQSDAWKEFAAVEAELGEARGIVFFHGQDTERAFAGEGLFLTYAAIGNGEALAIGHEVCKVLRLHGLTVEWNGSVDTRLSIPPFEWRKRRFTEPDALDLLVFGCAIEHRMAVIKTCRSVLGLDLATAKAGLDGLKVRTYRWDTSPPWVVMRGLSQADATRYAEALTAAGAEARVR